MSLLHSPTSHCESTTAVHPYAIMFPRCQTLTMYQHPHAPYAHLRMPIPAISTLRSVITRWDTNDIHGYMDMVIEHRSHHLPSSSSDTMGVTQPVTNQVQPHVCVIKGPMDALSSLERLFWSSIHRLSLAHL
jgi:hypothetical protein